MIFNELRKHGRLAARRHPLYDTNATAKIFVYVAFLFWGAYLIALGIGMAYAFAGMVPDQEPYHVMNSTALIAILTLDFLLRFPFQNIPTQEVKPYLLLPVKRSRIIDSLLIRSGLSLFNLSWLFLFFPFSILTIGKSCGSFCVLTYLVGIWLLMVANNYWHLLCRTLINEHAAWTLLPVVVYGGTACLLFIPANSPLPDFFARLGDGYITGNPLCFLTTLFVIALLWLANHKLTARLIYAELAKTDDLRIKRISDYRFFDRYGEVGEYMSLELKLLLRNRRCKGALRSSFIVGILFSAVLSFTSFYDGQAMTSFVCVYIFSIFGLNILLQIMSFEGNYIDGLMSRKTSILNLLKAKYCLYSIGEIIPFALTTPAIVMGKLTVLGAFSWAVYTAGFIYFCFFQVAVYNKQTMPLNEKVTSRQTNGATQMIICFVTLIAPLALYALLSHVWGEITAHVIILAIGLAFILTSPLWLKNIYHRFMKRRYENLEGFRDSRQ